MPTSEARYERVLRELRERIAAGEFEPDGQLPSTAELADHYGYSRETVRKAITIMKTLNEVEGEPGVAVRRVKREPA